jgi:hypothetical protein
MCPHLRPSVSHRAVLARLLLPYTSVDQQSPALVSHVVARSASSWGITSLSARANLCIRVAHRVQSCYAIRNCVGSMHPPKSAFSLRTIITSFSVFSCCLKCVTSLELSRTSLSLECLSLECLSLECLSRTLSNVSLELSRTLSNSLSLCVTVFICLSLCLS